MYKVIDPQMAGWAGLLAIFVLAASISFAAQNRTLCIPAETTSTDMIMVSVKINGQDHVMLLDTGGAEQHHRRG